MAVRERAFAAIYDPLQRAAERTWMGARRAALLGDVTGRVLEVGGGTGANLPHYRDGAKVVVSEPSEPMRRRLAAKLDTAAVPIELCRAPAEALPFDDASFDAVVATLVLCTVPDVAAALHEVRRVLRPDGRLLFIEHGGGHDGRKGTWQRRLDPAWTWVACGCHLTRDPARNVEAAGFTLERVEEFDPKGVPALLRPFVEGVARP